MTDPITPEAPTAPEAEVEVVDPKKVVDEAFEAARKATVKAEKDAYLAATAYTREAKGYVERYAAYDTTRLAFVEGTVAGSASAARELAKGLGHEGRHIETRPV